MKALNKIRGSLAKEGTEEATQRMAQPEFKSIIVKVQPKPNQERKHKVIEYGYKELVDGDVPEPYVFQYLPDPSQEDNLVTGYIPCSFAACVPVDGNNIYFYTRATGEGPEYQVVYSRADPDGSDVPARQIHQDWNPDVDDLWMNVLSELEEPNDTGEAELSEEAMNFLDADPLWLFGIAEPTTQRALEKTQTIPTLLCRGQKPIIDEWFAYLNADPDADKEFLWVVESFAEVVLPHPWSSFKGAGDVVTYWNNDSNETTAQHPFYDYFSSLLNHCRSATPQEHIKLRINRILWSYEAESQTDVAAQQPLVSPQYIRVMAEILGVNLKEQPFLVRMVKHFLRAFSQMYHEGELDAQEVVWCLDIIGYEKQKWEAATRVREEWPEDPRVKGQLFCIEYDQYCKQIEVDEPTDAHLEYWQDRPCLHEATCYCPPCEDYFCTNCFNRLHAKGCRAKHHPNYIIKCVLCKRQPAGLQCTYTRGFYCHDCYYKSHRRQLPKFLDLKPLKVDYTADRDKEKSKNGHPAIEVNPLMLEDPDLQDAYSKPAPVHTTLHETWHAFYDLRGVKYYYNFDTEESMRRPQDDLLGEDEEDNLQHAIEKEEILGHIAMSKAPRMMQAWKEGHDERAAEPEE